MPKYVAQIHARWGGELSLEQELEELAYQLPQFLRPLWRGIVAWLGKLIRKAQIERTMREVDEQAKKIGNKWAATERAAQVEAAVAKAQAEHPNAKVSVKAMPDHPCDAVVIEHPPTGDKASQLLGFSSIEIRATYETD